ncbi:MAG: biotin/lipoyl-binding protein [Chloroflexi bacterium]|nr:biotin/lipoyl-binding protein [Chloroflexota bacterium]
MKMWQAGALAAALMGVAGTAYGAYVLFSGSGQQKMGENQQLIPVEYGNVVNQVSTNGSLVFASREALTFGSQGTIGEVLVTEGQQVKKSQPLASLDDTTVASLEKAVAQAKVNVRNAEDALAKAKNPHTALEMAQAEAVVANARLSLKNAQESLDKLLPTSQGIAQAEAAVSSAKLALQNAQKSLAGVKSGPTADDLAKAQTQIDSVKVSLSNAENDLKLAQKDGDAKVKAAADALATTKEGYQGVYAKWLGIA